MTQTTSAILLSCGLATAALGQGAASAEPAAGVEAWVERTELPGGTTAYVVKARSRDEAPLDYTYELTLDKSGASGTSANRQSGAFTIEPRRPVVLSTVRINQGPADSVAVRLVITDADGGVAAEVTQVRAVERVDLADTTRARLPLDLPTAAPGPDEAAATDAPAPELEIDGLIIDETRTKLGRDFYDLFYGRWTPPPGASDYGITLRETPFRGRTVQLTVEVDGQAVYQRMLQPRLEILELTAAQATRAVAEHLSARAQISQQIELEDQRGTGL